MSLVLRVCYDIAHTAFILIPSHQCCLMFGLVGSDRLHIQFFSLVVLNLKSYYWYIVLVVVNYYFVVIFKVVSTALLIVTAVFAHLKQFFLDVGKTWEQC